MLLKAISSVKMQDKKKLCEVPHQISYLVKSIDTFCFPKNVEYTKMQKKRIELFIISFFLISSTLFPFFLLSFLPYHSLLI